MAKKTTIDQISGVIMGFSNAHTYPILMSDWNLSRGSVAKIIKLHKSGKTVQQIYEILNVGYKRKKISIKEIQITPDLITYASNLARKKGGMAIFARKVLAIFDQIKDLQALE